MPAKRGRSPFPVTINKNGRSRTKSISGGWTGMLPQEIPIMMVYVINLIFIIIPACRDSYGSRSVSLRYSNSSNHVRQHRFLGITRRSCCNSDPHQIDALMKVICCGKQVAFHLCVCSANKEKGISSNEYRFSPYDLLWVQSVFSA